MQTIDLLCHFWPLISVSSATSVAASCTFTVRRRKTAVQSSVSTRLDYCNSLVYGIADGLMQRLQAVQNAAAPLITGARRRDHIACSPAAALASSPPTSSVQAGRVSVQSAGWASPTVLDGRLSTRCRCRSPSTTVI